MFEQEDVERLRDNPQLQHLLTHYADLGKNDRKIWQTRLMEMDGLAPAQITKLHGDLLAFECVEQDTGAQRAAYRITPLGIRSLKLAVQGVAEDDVAEVCEDRPKIPRKKTATEVRRNRQPADNHSSVTVRAKRQSQKRLSSAANGNSDW